MEYSSIIDTEAEYTFESPVIVSSDETPLAEETLIIDDISSVDDVTPNEPIDASIPSINVANIRIDVDNGNAGVNRFVRSNIINTRYIINY